MGGQKAGGHVSYYALPSVCREGLQEFENECGARE